MNKKAIITIKSNIIEQKDEDIEVVSVGTFEKIDGGFKAQYEETELSGMKGTMTTVLIYEDNFSLIREGSTETKMNFKNNKEDAVIYSTPYGVMDLKTFTKGIEIEVDENGGIIKTVYSLLLEEQIVTTNLVIKIVTEN